LIFRTTAWNIYFAKNHIFNNTPFQAAFFDNVGYISREVIFHYYISIFFKLFGYNLLVFNISLLILGFVTVLFTTLIVQSLFNDILPALKSGVSLQRRMTYQRSIHLRNELRSVLECCYKTPLTLISAIVINFFPLHFTHIFMGHRYAISAPLMIVSFFFLYTAFSKNSCLRATVSGIFAALCMGSSVIGKQYLYGLVLSSFFLFFGRHGFRKSKEKTVIGITWMASFIIAATPLIFYILFNYSAYNIRERNLIQEFFSQYQNGGVLALQPYFDQIKEVFLSKYTFRRWFLPDFYVIPPTYYLLILPGLFLALIKRRFEIVFLAVIPVMAAFFSGAYDFRVLIAVPIWVILMAFSLNWLLKHNWFWGGITVGFICVALGLFPSVKYLWNVSKNPNYFWLLPHKDVAVSRLVQDIVVGVKNPSSKMKWNEFNRKINTSAISYDTFAAPVEAYAVMHLYLQNYNDKKILTFIDQGNQLLATPEQILNFNISTIKNYSPANKDLKLVWEISDRSSYAINFFRRYNKYGKDEIISDNVDGNQFSIYVLTINNRYINKFKNEI